MESDSHYLRKRQIGAHEAHAAMAEPSSRDLHCDRHVVEQDVLVAPVEFVGLGRAFPVC